jgi:hypothetical protein
MEPTPPVRVTMKRPDGIGRREGHIVGQRPDRFAFRRCRYPVSQIEHAAGFASGTVDIEQDGCDVRVGDRCIQHRRQLLVTGHS